MRVFLLLWLVMAEPALARSIYLNGIDISSAKSQEVKNVNVRIMENGDVFLEAPNYQVIEEDTYAPLTSYVSGLNKPEHQEPKGIEANAAVEKLVPLSPKPVNQAAKEMLADEKAEKNAEAKKDDDADAKTDDGNADAPAATKNSEPAPAENKPAESKPIEKSGTKSPPKSGTSESSQQAEK